MYRVELGGVVTQLMSPLYFIRMWNYHDEATARDTTIKLFLSFYSLLYPISFLVGGIIIEDRVQSIFLIECSILTAVIFVKLVFIIRKQKLTSGACLCGSIYSIAFARGTSMQYMTYLYSLFYNLFDIFMITFLGNEVYLSSGRLCYCLFESNWFDQPEATKRCIIIFGELLKLPQVLVIGKLYPLTLDTFTRILNSAYSMFNILQNMKE